VVPKARIPELFELIDRLKARFGVPIPSFGHLGDGNIHVNIMVPPEDTAAIARAHEAERVLFEGVVRLEGSISGEHGIGWLKRGQLEPQLGPVGYDLHLRIKRAFDPKNLLNPGKKR